MEVGSPVDSIADSAEVEEEEAADATEMDHLPDARSYGDSTHEDQSQDPSEGQWHEHSTQADWWS